MRSRNSDQERQLKSNLATTCVHAHVTSAPMCMPACICALHTHSGHIGLPSLLSTLLFEIRCLFEAGACCFSYSRWPAHEPLGSASSLLWLQANATEPGFYLCGAGDLASHAHTLAVLILPTESISPVSTFRFYLRRKILLHFLCV